MTLPAKTMQRARVARAGTGSWLLATFLVLLGVTLVALVPASSSAVSRLRAHTSQDAQGTAAAENSERGFVRAPSRVVRAVQPKGAGGGHDLLAVRAADIACTGASHEVPAGGASISARIVRRALGARAPPALAA